MTGQSVFKFSQPGTFSDPLTEVLRSGARSLLAQAVEAKAAAFDAFIETWGLKHDKAAECLARDSEALLVFYAFPAEKSWQRPDGHNQLPKLIQGVKFINGIEALRQQSQAAA